MFDLKDSILKSAKQHITSDYKVVTPQERQAGIAEAYQLSCDVVYLLEEYYCNDINTAPSQMRRVYDAAEEIMQILTHVDGSNAARSDVPHMDAEGNIIFPQKR